MIVYYDATEQVAQYGKAKFYEMVREHIAQIFEASGLEVCGDDQAIIAIYQQYAYAFAIGAKTQNPLLFQENFFEEFIDPIGGWETVTDNSGQLLLEAGVERGLIKGPLVVSDSAASVTYTEVVVPNSAGTAQAQQLALRTSLEMFHRECVESVGLYGLMQQLFPGRYLNHYGDDFKGLILVCEHEGLF